MKLKPGVKVTGVSPEIAVALQVAEGVYRELGHELVVTSLLDGKHSPRSLHYVGRAFDCRTREMPPDVQNRLVARLREALGAEFDVVLESDHAHVELDPKPKAMPA